MVYSEALEVIALIYDDRYVRISVIIVLCFSGVLYFCLGPISRILVLASHILGCILAYFLVNYQQYFKLYVEKLLKFYTLKGASKPLKENTVKASCSICDDLSCRRHQISKSVTPWREIIISSELNDSLEQVAITKPFLNISNPMENEDLRPISMLPVFSKRIKRRVSDEVIMYLEQLLFQTKNHMLMEHSLVFFTRILEHFVSSWYNQFTANKEFMNELKFCLKYASATLVNRFREVDYIHVITNKLVPQAIKHIDDYLYMQQIAKLKNVKFNEVIVEYLGKNLHPATTNRNNELKYLQHLSHELLQHLLPQCYIKCSNYSVLLRELLSGWVLLPLMDVLADPNIINSLVIFAVNYKSSKTLEPQNVTTSVEFLDGFIKIDHSKKSSFAINLTKIKNDTELLYALMQFLKKQDQVHLLQFCLDVDDFNTKLLTPDLSKKQLEELHAQASSLYKEYLKSDSFNFIGCPPEICNEFYGLISDIYSVAKLRTSKPLYQAYDFAFNSLEEFWLPHFFHSNEFYNCICGSKNTSTYSKASIKSKKYYEQTNYGAVSKISSSIGKIKGVLKTAAPIQGSLDTLDNDFTEDSLSSESLMRDLSNWKISIPTYQVIPANKITYFCINVLHVGNSSSEGNINNWIVWRKDQDFFTLKSKLVEFHGENEICGSPLPSRRAGSAVESRISKYEDFLTDLLQKPSLRGSDLLHTFLTSEDDFTLVISTMASGNQDIGNIYQSVAYKLRKEKGQHLEGFINTFMNSVFRQKQDKIDFAEEGLEVDLSIKQGAAVPKTFASKIFKDNLGVSYKTSLESSGGGFNSTSFSESLFYLFRNVFKMRYGILRIYVAICNVAQQLIDLISKTLIEKKIRAALTQHNLAYLIGMLEDVIFTSHSPHTSEEYEERRKIAFNDIQFCPSYLDQLLGGHINIGLVNLLEILQNPHYNKQLAYNLLDTLLLDMFPELNASSSE